MDNTNSPTISEEVASAPQQSNFPKGLFLGILIGIIVMIIAIGVFIFLPGGKITLPSKFGQSPVNPFNASENTLTSLRQWISCGELRDIIEEGMKLYVACPGGVIVVDKANGAVVDSITMTQGLSNNFVNSIVKDENNLYIGTQDGFTIYNLQTKAAKKISVAEGLKDGANVKLALDGKTLWVGTFNGLNSYDLLTGRLTSYPITDIVDNSTEYEAGSLLVTQNALYVAVLANANTPGGIARFDKKTKQWKKYGVYEFENPSDQYARLDAGHMAQVGNKIYIAESDALWEGENTVDTKWKRLEGVTDNLKKQTGESYASIGGLVSLGDNLGIWSQGSLYLYNSNNSALSLYYPLISEGPNNISKAKQLGSFLKEHTLWIYDQDDWLRWLDLNTKKTGVYHLQGRPIWFDALLATIDGNPIVRADGSIYEYSVKDQQFKLLLEGKNGIIETGPLFIFYPIEETTKVFILSQTCGQGCSRAKGVIFDYVQKTTKPITFSQEMEKELFGNSSSFEFGSKSIVFERFDPASHSFIFTEFENKKEYIFDTISETWSSRTAVAKPVDPQAVQVNCNQSFTFKDKKQFNKNDTCSQRVENDVYEWTLTQQDSSPFIIKQKTKATAEIKTLSYPTLPKPYSPFTSTFNRIGVRSMYYAQGKLWIATERGLLSYDPISTDWKLYDAKEGLISNDVNNFVVNPNSLWIFTNSGGLSGIPL